MAFLCKAVCCQCWYRPIWQRYISVWTLQSKRYSQTTYLRDRVMVNPNHISTIPSNSIICNRITFSTLDSDQTNTVLNFSKGIDLNGQTEITDHRQSLGSFLFLLELHMRSAIENNIKPPFSKLVNRSNTISIVIIVLLLRYTKAHAWYILKIAYAISLIDFHSRGIAGLNIAYLSRSCCTLIRCWTIGCPSRRLRHWTVQ